MLVLVSEGKQVKGALRGVEAHGRSSRTLPPDQRDLTGLPQGGHLWSANYGSWALSCAL